MHVTHRNTRYAKHVCPDCDAGLVWTAYTEPAPRPAWTAEQERAAVVAWLRAECGSPGHEERFCAYCNVRRNIAADIERGEHRREEAVCAHGNTECRRCGIGPGCGEHRRKE
jgi:hypothetical protein